MRRSIVLMMMVFLPVIAFGQMAQANGTDFLDGVRPFISFIEDAAVPENMYGEGQFRYADFEGGSSITFGAIGDYLVSPMIVAGGRLAFASVSPEHGDGESGLLDVDVYGRYTVSEGPAMRIVAGALINLPVGSKDIGEGTFDFGGFGALRYAMTQGVLHGHFGLRINGKYENEGYEADRELQILFGGGILYPTSEQLTISGEFTFESAEYDGGDSALQLTPGVDFQMDSGLKLRGALALGLSDGAPDLELIAGAAMPFGG